MNQSSYGSTIKYLIYFCVLGLLFLPSLCPALPDSAAGASFKKDKWLLVVMTPGGELNGYGKLRRTVESARPGLDCVCAPYGRVTIDLVREIDPEFIILGPQGLPWCRYTGRIGVQLQSFLWTLPYVAEEMNIPMLGICGGHQAIAMAFGGKVGPIRASTGDCLPYTSQGQLGLISLQRTEDDLLFAGMGDKIYLKQSHYDEVKILPKEFILLAWDKISPNQIMRHAHRPVYGIQGHPELRDSRLNHGAALIRNFLEIAATHNSILRSPRSKGASRGSAPPSATPPWRLW
jgi:GMP synthase (glutamine-hydrolysing)